MILSYELAELKDFNGSSLKFRVEELSTLYAVRISSIIEKTSFYKELSQKLQSPRLILYFQYFIKREIYAYIQQACVLEWYQKNHPFLALKESIIEVPRSGIGFLLRRCWEFKNISLKNSLLQDLYNWKQILNMQWKTKNGFFKKKNNFYSSFSNLIIACHYAEGIDLNKRNDLNWYFQSGINPKNVLIYFDEKSMGQKGKLIDRNIIDQIEALGFHWVALKKGIVGNQNSNIWNVPRLPKSYLLSRGRLQNSTERWTRIAGNFLLERVHYWKTFHQNFNIRIHYIAEENDLDNIAQAIAFDIDENHKGVLLGKQRSEIFLPFSSCLGYHPKHVFFTWNLRSLDYITAGFDQIHSLIIIGYPYDIPKKTLNFRPVLQQKGVKYIFALFDNAYGKDTNFSQKDMVQFYKSFLEWVISDTAIGLIIKSKKPQIFNHMERLLYPLFEKAFKTNRCVRINDEKGRYSSDASFGADMAIGIGISTAVTEAVIGGCRGIHYDVTCLREHEFYKWGHGKIIFDDLETLMKALKKFKENPNSDLGEWALYKNELDSYNDNKGGQRMGMYMKWLLESFEKGNKREESLRFANNLFINKWGRDKVWCPSESEKNKNYEN